MLIPENDNCYNCYKVSDSCNFVLIFTVPAVPAVIPGTIQKRRRIHRFVMFVITIPFGYDGFAFTDQQLRE